MYDKLYQFLDSDVDSSSIDTIVKSLREMVTNIYTRDFSSLGATSPKQADDGQSNPHTSNDQQNREPSGRNAECP